MKVHFFLFVLLSYTIQSQSIVNAEIIYGQKIFIPKKNLQKNNYYSNLYDKEREKMNDASKYIEYRLLYNNYESSFKVIKSLNLKDSGSDIEFAILHVKGDGERYYSSKTKETMWSHNAFGRDIILVDSIHENSWKITGQTKKINNYTAVKAVKKIEGNKEIIAWFTPDISVDVGPIGHYGLPGLILELKENDFLLYVKKIKLNKNKKKIKKPQNGDLLNKIDYDNYMEKATDNLFKY